MYTTRPPALIKPLIKELIWRVPRNDRTVYLTFDDGPTNGVTSWVLDTLAEHEAKATFFCVGRNVAESPDLFDRIKREGHAIGNHTWAHEDGWTTPSFTYRRSVLQCQALTGTSLFRPPYGRVGRKLARCMSARFQLVMWDVLSGDFDASITGEQCERNVVKASSPGAIIVFHDSVKAEPRLRFALPRILDHFSREGFAMQALRPELLRA